MDGSETTQNRRSTDTKPKYFRSSLFILGLSLILFIFFYYEHRQKNQAAVNHNYFRIISEVAQELNNNYEQLYKLLNNGATTGKIQQFFPSFQDEISSCKSQISNEKSVGSEGSAGTKKPKYTEKKTEDSSDLKNSLPSEKDIKLDVKASGGKLYIEVIHTNLTGCYSLVERDLLPAPSEGISHYLVVNDQNEALVSSSTNRVLSIQNLEEISRNVSTSMNRDWLKLANRQNKLNDDEIGSKLPGYSYAIDIDLNPGDYRLFLYPFKFDTPFYQSIVTSGSENTSSESDNDGPNNGTSLLAHIQSNQTLHIVAILPTKYLESIQGERRKIAFVSIVVVFFAFIWAMVKLYMSSNLTPVSTVFYKFTMASGYALFAMILALLLAGYETFLEKSEKDARAYSIARKATINMGNEIGNIIQQIVPHHNYFSCIANSKNEKKGALIDCLENEKLQAKFSDDTKPVGFTNSCYGYGDLNSLEKTYHQDSENYCADDILEKVSEPNKNYFVDLFGPGVNFIKKVNNPEKGKKENGGNELEPIQQYFDVSESSAYSQNRILSVVLLNEDGKTVYPAIRYIEKNSFPRERDLSTRDYFQRATLDDLWDIEVKNISGDDQKAGSDLLEKVPFFIQRLRNKSDGTLGSTLSQPLGAMYRSEDDRSNQENLVKNYVVAADISIPSLSQIENYNRESLQDFQFMVVHRDSGDVLFHWDSKRVLIENLFESGSGTSALHHRIRAGFDSARDSSIPKICADNNDRDRAECRPSSISMVEGYYHGYAGWFLVQSTPIDEWVVVVFHPRESMENYFANLFLYNFLCLLIPLFSIYTVLTLIRWQWGTGRIKEYLNIPKTINRRRIILFSSVWLAALITGYWVGFSIDMHLMPSGSAFQSWRLALPLSCMLMVLLWGGAEYWRAYYRSTQYRRGSPFVVANKGLDILIICFVVLGSILSFYMLKTGETSSSALRWYYGKISTAWENQQKEQFRADATARFTNSITIKNQDPFRLLGIDSSNSGNENGEASKKSSDGLDTVMPSDVGSFSSLTRSASFPDWFVRYMVNKTQFPLETRGVEPRDIHVGYLISLLVILGLLFSFWIFFVRRILFSRIYGTEDFLRHLENLYDQSVQSSYSNQAHSVERPKLVIETGEEPAPAPYLDWLVDHHRSNPNAHSEFGWLLSRSSLLQQLVDDENESLLPILRLNIESDPELGAHYVYLSDFDAALVQPESRKLLLKFLVELKSLILEGQRRNGDQDEGQLDGQLLKVTIYASMKSLQSLTIIDTLGQDKSSVAYQLNAVEQFSWAKCLMDFTINLPMNLIRDLNPGFLAREVKAMPAIEAAFIGDMSDSSNYDNRRWLDLDDTTKVTGEWQSIRFILHKVESLYRYLWCTLSPSEKLVLYHLSKFRRVNPLNHQVLEKLALAGLIKVKRGRIRIVNQSFCTFVQSAESGSTLRSLLKEGSQGNWQDYRLPITLVLLLVLAALALFSGDSLYVIIATVLGFLGSLTAVMTSVHSLRDIFER